jgi:hypothetical protein
MTTIIIISHGPNAEQNVEVVNNDTAVDTDTLTQVVQQALNQAQ